MMIFVCRQCLLEYFCACFSFAESIVRVSYSPCTLIGQELKNSSSCQSKRRLKGYLLISYKHVLYLTREVAPLDPTWQI
ncbi:unnamed protein product [Amoebophrya sp. A25]|nr:unnamed protein product [Amoebophrya sp. A25]|eukprot:GSA25T00017842001.1